MGHGSRAKPRPKSGSGAGSGSFSSDSFSSDSFNSDSRERGGEPVLRLEDCLQLGGAVEEVLQALVNPEKDVGPQLVAGSVVGDAARNR